MCNAPSNLTLHRNDISFVPTDNVIVYEFLIGTSKIPVSTPDDTKNGKFIYKMNTANYGELSANKGMKIKVRALCFANYWYTEQVETNYAHYKDDPTKFSEYSNEVLYK